MYRFWDLSLVFTHMVICVQMCFYLSHICIRFNSWKHNINEYPLALLPNFFQLCSLCYLWIVSHSMKFGEKVPHSAVKSHQHTACIWKLVPVFGPLFSKGKARIQVFSCSLHPRGGQKGTLGRKNSHVRRERAALFVSWGEGTKRSEIMNWIKWEKVERWKKPHKGRAEKKTTAAQKERWKHSRPDQTGYYLALPKQS